MTRRRWIADEVSGDRAFLIGQNAEHLARVLRARVGQHFEIATPTGVRLGEIVAIEPERVVFATMELPVAPPDKPSTKINLYLAVFKFDRFEWAIEKCTELGTATIVPVISKRTDAHLASAAMKRSERWRKIAREATQQSRGQAIPEIADPEKVEQAISNSAGKRIVLTETEREQRLADLVQGIPELSIAIGPEGGWTPAELALFAKNEWTAASLGTTILRAETAAIASVAVVRGVTF